MIEAQIEWSTLFEMLGITPTGGVGVELGVGEGDTTVSLLSITRPAKLHLVDYWTSQEWAAYPDSYNVDQQGQDARLHKVLDRFEDEISSGVVEVRKTMTVDAARDFDDECFDWIYLDANHSYPAVLTDLQTYYPKLKRGGLLFAHDYCRGLEYFGVMQAVSEFISTYPDMMLLGKSGESFPAAAMMKEPGA
ncbi:hypothetical protein LCGC14_2663890 [marine sediment metagenome]|uniref:Class I SAM-dependent methyltransferase n=1 Tax=marine sediment metagenome TaxID=412755 RepID=A0A0F9ADH9_9ZZZZ